MGPTSARTQRHARGLKPAATTASISGRSRGGGTQLYDAIYLAADDLMKPKDGRKALVVFSDGADRGSKETLNDAIDAADRANVSIYTIYFKGERTARLEQRLSRSGRPARRHGRRLAGRRWWRRLPRWWGRLSGRRRRQSARQ